MKVPAMLVCLIFMFGQTPALLAQFTPIIAKQRSVSYQTQPDGSEIVVQQTEGTYFRSSSGSVVENMFHIEDGQEQGEGQTSYFDSFTGRIYSLRHDIKRAVLKDVWPKSLRSLVPSNPNFIGEAVINGLNCVATPVFLWVNNQATPVGKNWWSLDVDLLVKTETTVGGIRKVRELYDINFAEPSSSKFKIPSGYMIDGSEWQDRQRRRESTP